MDRHTSELDERVEVRWLDGGYREVVVPWTLTASGRALTEEQREAAYLLAVVEDVERVDTLLGFEPDTTGHWLATDDNFHKVAVGISSDYHPAEERTTYDFSKILKPKQLEAAHLYYEMALTQVEVARRLHVTDRTFRNWAADPAFCAYGEQLRQSRNERLTQESQTQEVEILERLGEHRRLAIKVLERALSEGDVRVAMELLRPWLKER